MFSGRHYVLPVPVDISERSVLPSMFPEGVSFVAPRTAVSIDEATVGIGCLHFTTGGRKGMWGGQRERARESE